MCCNDFKFTYTSKNRSLYQLKLPYTIRSFMIVIIAGLGNLPAVAVSGMGLGIFEGMGRIIRY